MSLDWFGQTNRSDLFARWCSLSERALRAMLVLVLYLLLQDCPELAFAPDDRSVQHLVADDAHPSLCKGVRSGRDGRGGDWFRPDRGEHVIEAAGLLVAAIVDDEANCMVEADQQVQRLLGWARPCRIGGDAGELHDPGVDLDPEQHVEPAR